jgi:hypothetical protein
VRGYPPELVGIEVNEFLFLNAVATKMKSICENYGAVGKVSYLPFSTFVTHKQVICWVIVGAPVVRLPSWNCEALNKMVSN